MQIQAIANMRHYFLTNLFLYRWRLQKAFYKAEKKCISYDCFPGGHCWCCFDCPPTVDNNANSCGDNDGDNDADNIADNHTHRAATLGDLEQLTNGKPLYISNVVANNWCESYETRRKYCLLTMSSKGVYANTIISFRNRPLKDRLHLVTLQTCRLLIESPVEFD